MNQSFTILAAASALPARVVTNEELEKCLDTSDEWIYQRTGIKQRHLVTDEQNVDLATSAVEKVLQAAGVKAKDVGGLIVSTMSPDYLTPSLAAAIQGRIGAENCFALDINAACAGFVYGLKLAQWLLNEQRYVIVVGSEVLSKLVDWQDRSTAVLFGDGAGAVLLSNDDCGYYLADDFKSFGKQWQALTAGHLQPLKQITTDFYFQMDGHKVYQFAVNETVQSIQRALDHAHLAANDIDYYLLHQANWRIIKQIAKKLQLPIERFPMNMQEVGNTSSASEPILLAKLQSDIQRGQTILFSGFGGGLQIGTAIVQF